jgi:hypothetical protein
VSDTAWKLLEDMKAYSEASYPAPDVDLAPRFAEPIRAFGPEHLIVHLFRTHADSELTIWLQRLAFVWTEFSFATWLQILTRLSDDRRFIYQFLWFASSSLALDLRRLQATEPNVQAELRSEAFRKGGARPMSRATRARLDDDFDYEAVWRRLAAEGAPMQDWSSL